jgi:hypothetical protein
MANELQVLTKGDRRALYVNGTKVGEFKGQIQNRGPIGIIAQSEKQQRNKWTFSDFAVSEYQ